MKNTFLYAAMVFCLTLSLSLLWMSIRFDIPLMSGLCTLISITLVVAIYVNIKEQNQ
jgi:hypothetical protein